MKEWESKSRGAFERYLEELKREIEPGSGLAGVEAAMVRLSPGLLGEILETLSQSEEAFSPPRDTDRMDEKRATKGKRSKHVRQGRGKNTTVTE